MVWAARQKNCVAIPGILQHKQAIYNSSISEVIYRCILCHENMLRGDSKKTIPQFYVLDQVVHILYFQRKAFLSLLEHVFTGFPFGLICTDPHLLNSLEINKCIRLDSNFFWVECLLFLHLFFLEDRDSETNLQNKRKPIPDPRAGTALVYISAFLLFYFF